MVKAIKFQWHVMTRRKEFLITFSIVLFYCVVSFAYSGLQQWGGDVSLVLSADAIFAGTGITPLWHYFGTLFPFLAVLPCSLSYINDRESGVLPILLTRLDKQQYYRSKLIACFLGNVTVIMIPFLFNLLLCHIAFPTGYQYPFGGYGSLNFAEVVTGSGFIFESAHQSFPFLGIFLTSPLLYSLLYIFLLSFASGVIGTATLCLSFLTKKYRALLFVPAYTVILISSLVNQTLWNKNVGVGNVSFSFTDYYLMDYVAAFSYPGQSPAYILVVLTIIALFCVLACLKLSRRDEFLEGTRHD